MFFLRERFLSTISNVLISNEMTVYDQSSSFDIIKESNGGGAEYENQVKIVTFARKNRHLCEKLSVLRF